jgi:cytoskeletal protein CcmA (bactofilin family)
MPMFKKDESAHTSSTNVPSSQPPQGRKTAPPRSSSSAVIGPSITIKGDVSGDEDLIILGKLHGTINLAKHNVTIGPSGKVKADVHGRNLIVEGEVEGDLKADEQIVLRHTARVEGSISAPRVALEDGAVFRGGIEMDSAKKLGPESQSTKPIPAKGYAHDKGPDSDNEPATGASGKGLSA